mgnify:CR=1 FL=1
MRKYFKTTAMKKTIIILTAILFILTLSKKTSAKTKKYLLVDSKIKVNSKKNKVNSKDKKNIMIVLLSPDLSKDTLFTNKKGETVKYNHDVAFNIMKDTLENLACFVKYKSYTATNNIPVVLRGKELWSCDVQRSLNGLD